MPHFSLPRVFKIKAITVLFHPILGRIFALQMMLFNKVPRHNFITSMIAKSLAKTYAVFRNICLAMSF